MELQHVNNTFNNLVPYEHYKIKDLKFESTEHTLENEINNKNSLFHSVQHSLFYTYLDYVEVHHMRTGLLRELKHFGRFIN